MTDRNHATATTGHRRTPDEERDALVYGIWETLERLRDTVENDHDHRLRRIEADLHWVVILLGSEIVALVSAAIARLL